MSASRATMAVAVLFGEQESAEQVNCIVSSMHQTGPLYPQLLTYRCGAANRRIGPSFEPPDQSKVDNLALASERI